MNEIKKFAIELELFWFKMDNLNKKAMELSHLRFPYILEHHHHQLVQEIKLFKIENEYPYNLVVAINEAYYRINKYHTKFFEKVLNYRLAGLGSHFNRNDNSIFSRELENFLGFDIYQAK
jgi:hypothetical protein